MAPAAGQRACPRVPPGLPSGTRAARSRLPINAFIGPGTFMSRCASLRGGTPLASGPRCARPLTEPKALLNRRRRAVRARPGRGRRRALRGARMKGACACARQEARARSTRRTRARRARPRGWRWRPSAAAVKRWQCACVASARSSARGRWRAVLDHLAGMLPPARDPARRGPCPRAGSRTRRDENRRCRARKRSTERDAPSATAPKARSKILPGASRSHGARRRFGVKPPRAASCAKARPST